MVVDLRADDTRPWVPLEEGDDGVLTGAIFGSVTCLFDDAGQLIGGLDGVNFDIDVVETRNELC